MKKSQLLIFLLILAADLVFVLLDFKTGEFLFKPLICIWLMACFILQTRTVKSNLKIWVVLALLFCWMGDVILLLQADGSLYFLLGLSAFLVAHIFYILFFHFIRLKENISGRWYFLLAVVVYYAVLAWLLSPHLGEMALPVRIYGIVISFMLMMAMHMIYGKNKNAGLWMLAGASLFVLSDSILAINKFYQSFEAAGVLIMLTYGLAQLFITMGAIRYLSSGYKG